MLNFYRGNRTVHPDRCGRTSRFRAVPTVADRQLHSAVGRREEPRLEPAAACADADGLPLRRRHLLQLAMAVAHRHRRARHPEEDPRRHVRTPADAADPLLRHAPARRHHEPLHQ